MEKGQGSSADINLALVALLREVNLEAYPVVLKTKDRGFVRVNNPSMTEFNHVIVACVIEGEMVLMDASDDEYEANMLPIYCLNGQGLLVDPKFPRWVDLVSLEE